MKVHFFDGVSFNCDWVARQTKKKFVNHPMHTHHYTRLKPGDKKKLLAEIYEEIKKNYGRM